MPGLSNPKLCSLPGNKRPLGTESHGSGIRELEPTVSTFILLSHPENSPPGSWETQLHLQLRGLGLEPGGRQLHVQHLHSPSGSKKMVPRKPSPPTGPCFPMQTARSSAWKAHGIPQSSTASQCQRSMPPRSSQPWEAVGPKATPPPVRWAGGTPLRWPSGHNKRGPQPAPPPPPRATAHSHLRPVLGCT